VIGYKVLAMVVLVFIAACSTAPITEEEGRPVPADRIYALQLVAVDANPLKARVSFFRDSGFVGAGCTHDIYVNNVKAFAIKQGEYIHVSLDPGPYFFRLETGAGLCPDISTSQETIINAGEKRVYRILLPSDGSLRLTRIE